MSYQILGRAVKNEHLALIIYSTVFGGAWLAVRGGGGAKTPKPTTVQEAKQSALLNLKTDSSEEDRFVMEFIREAEAADAAAAAKH